MHSDTLRSLGGLQYNRPPNSLHPTLALIWYFWVSSVLVFVISLQQNTCNHHKQSTVSAYHALLWHSLEFHTGPCAFMLYTQPLFNIASKHAVNHHAFTDDNQLYKISTLDTIHQSIETLQNCTTDVKSWMTTNKLQLNDNKTKAMVILSNRMSINSPLPSVIHTGDADVPFVSC